MAGLRLDNFSAGVLNARRERRQLLIIKLHIWFALRYERNDSNATVTSNDRTPHRRYIQRLQSDTK